MQYHPTYFSTSKSKNPVLSLPLKEVIIMLKNKKLTEVSAVKFDSLKEIAMTLHHSFSDQARKAGFSNLSEFLRIYEAFEYSKYYDD